MYKECGFTTALMSVPPPGMLIQEHSGPSYGLPGYNICDLKYNITSSKHPAYYSPGPPPALPCPLRCCCIPLPESPGPKPKVMPYGIKYHAFMCSSLLSVAHVCINLNDAH